MILLLCSIPKTYRNPQASDSAKVKTGPMYEKLSQSKSDLYSIMLLHES